MMKKNVLIVVLVLALVLVGCAEHEHSWNEVASTAPTCTADGERVFKCKGCGATRTEMIEKLSHSFGEWGNSDDLKTNTRECSVCQEKETRDGIVVNPTNAQELINSVNTGKVYFTAGEYGDLSLTHSKKVSTAKETHSKKDADVENLNDTTTYDYCRQIENLELIGGDGVVVAGSFICNSGHQYGTKDNAITDPLRNITIDSTNNSYYSYISIDGLEFKAMTFEAGQISFGNQMDSTVMKNIKIEGCVFDGSGTSNMQAVRFLADSNSFENVTIENTKIDNYFQGIWGEGFKNITIKDCEVSNTEHNAIAIQSSNNTFTGTIALKNNTISNTADRAVRFGNGKDATIVVEKNVFSEAVDTNGDLLKTSTLTNCTYSFTGNTYNDVSMKDISGRDSSWIVTIPTEEV